MLRKHSFGLVVLLVTLLGGALGIARAANSGSVPPVPAIDGGEVWVTSQGTDRVLVLKGQGTLVDTIQLPAGAGPHIVTFSPNGKFAYVSGMGDGKLYILDADSRQIAQSLAFGTAGTHQAKASPDGSLLLVSQVMTKNLVKLAYNAAERTWAVEGILPLAALNKSPVCSVFRDDGQRAYVSLLPNGIAVVDVPNMRLLTLLPTDGFVACGMIKAHNGRTVVIASSGGGGHIFRLDTASETLTDAGTLGAPDWHSFNLSPDEKVGYGTSPGSDQLILIDLTQQTSTKLEVLALDATLETGNDQPDAIAVSGNTVFVTLRASGKLAVIQANQRKVSYVDISAPAPLNPANCNGCAVHGVAIRP